MTWPGAEPVIVQRYEETGEDDRYGTPVSAWVPLPEPLMCGVADDSGTIEVTPGRVEVAYDYLLILQPGTEVLTSDRLVVRGRPCKVVKPKFEWNGLFSVWNPGGTVYVKAVDG